MHKTQPVVYGVRHGRVDHEDFYWGTKNVPLSLTARQDIEQISKDNRLSKIGHIYTSEQHRAVETAMIASDVLGIQYTIDPRLSAKDYGIFNGVSKIEVHNQRNRYSTLQEKWLWKPRTGESYIELAIRTRSILIELSNGLSGDVLLVTHEGNLKVIDALYTGELNSVNQSIAYGALLSWKPAKSVFEIGSLLKKNMGEP